jgi:ATP-dependent Clp protease ATP-binding subunit ClpA
MKGWQTMSEVEQNVPAGHIVRPPFLDKFTERARRSLYLAQEEARDFNHDYIGTEHLLLGMLRESKGIAALALNEMGVMLEMVRQALTVITPPGKERPIGAIGLTPRAKKVVELAAKEARELGDRFLGTEHLLLGLLQEGEGIGVGILLNLGLGLDVAQVRAQVLRVREQRSANAGSARSNVVSCRLGDSALNALDALVEAGVRGTRSEAAAWLIEAGIEARRDFFQKINDTVSQIRELRAQAQSLAEQAPPPHPPAPSSHLSDGEGETGHRT